MSVLVLLEVAVVADVVVEVVVDVATRMTSYVDSNDRLIVG